MWLRLFSKIERMCCSFDRVIQKKWCSSIWGGTAIGWSMRMLGRIGCGKVVVTPVYPVGLTLIVGRYQ